MRHDLLRLVPHIDLHVPGAPYYATSQVHRGVLPAHRNHDYAEFTAIIAGEGQLVSYVEGQPPRVDQLLPGQLHLFRPVDLHEIIGLEPDGLVLCNIAFPLTSWLTFMQLAELDPGLMTSARPPVRNFDPSDHDWLRPHRRALDRFWNGPTKRDLIEFWNAMATHFAPGSASRTAPGAPTWLRDALEHMRDEKNLRGGVEQFVSLSHVSGAHLSRSTMRYCGMTPTQLVNQLRMWRAAMLLATTSESIARIADRVGFASSSYFTKAFRKEHDLSPRQFRNRLVPLGLPSKPNLEYGQGAWSTRAEAPDFPAWPSS